MLTGSCPLRQPKQCLERRYSHLIFIGGQAQDSIFNLTQTTIHDLNVTVALSHLRSSAFSSNISYFEIDLKAALQRSWHSERTNHHFMFLPFPQCRIHVVFFNFRRNFSILLGIIIIYKTYSITLIVKETSWCCSLCQIPSRLMFSGVKQMCRCTLSQVCELFCPHRFFFFIFCKMGSQFICINQLQERDFWM